MSEVSGKVDKMLRGGGGGGGGGGGAVLEHYRLKRSSQSNLSRSILWKPG